MTVKMAAKSIFHLPLSAIPKFFVVIGDERRLVVGGGTFRTKAVWEEEEPFSFFSIHFIILVLKCRQMQELS